MDIHQVADNVLKALEAEIARRGYSPDSIKAYTEDKYRNGIYDAAAQFWKEGSRGSFNTRMRAVIKFGLSDAFMAGADELGLEEADLLNDDIKQRDEWISEEQSHIDSLFEYLDTLANTPGASLAQANPRLDLWAARWSDIKQRAIIYLDRDGRYEWQLGATEQHCDSCSKLNGIVKRASFWASHGVEPQNPPNPMLTCGGWKCDCHLVQTDKKVTRGKLPRLP